MKTILKLLFTAGIVLLLSYYLPGVTVTSFVAALWVAVVLAILRVLVKPILVILTLPITIITLGLFLFVINALLILLVDKLVDGFSVANFWVALLFSFLLSILQSLLFSLIGKTKKAE